MEPNDSTVLEPPLSVWWVPCALIACISFLFYPIKTVIGLFLIYATVVGYKKDSYRKQQRAHKRNNSA